MKKCIMWGSLSIHVDCCLQFDAFRYSDADWLSSIICIRKQAIYRMSYWEQKVPISPSYKMWALFSEDKAVKVFDSPFAFCRTIFDVSKVREFVTTQYHQSTASHSEDSSQERTYARTLTVFRTKSTHSGYLVSQIRLFSGICWLWGALSTLEGLTFFLWKGTVFANGCLPPNLHQQGWRHKPYLITSHRNMSSIFHS